MSINIFIELATILIASILIDIADGEVREKVCPIHPVKICWQLGSLILRRIKKTRASGIMLWILTVMPLLLIYAIAPTLMLFYADKTGKVALLVVSLVMCSVINKFTISFRLLNWYFVSILDYIDKNNEAKARVLLQEIVRRDVFALDRSHIYSALIETYVESLVDGFVSPLFWFSILGLVGSYVQRLANTMDSLVGYRHDPYREVGWFSANIDTILNVPGSIIFSVLSLLSSYRRGMFREFLKNLESGRDVSSVTARVVFAVACTLLKVDLEKPGEYKIGIYGRLPDIEHCKKLLSCVYRTSSLSVLLFLLVLFAICLLIP